VGRGRFALNSEHFFDPRRLARLNTWFTKCRRKARSRMRRAPPPNRQGWPPPPRSC